MGSRRFLMGRFIIKNDNQMILENMEDLNENLKEDLEFAKRTEEAYKRHERGKFISMSFEKFLKELSKC